jgi:putative membrane protein
VSRAAQHLVLVLVGLATAVMLFKGTYLNYVRPALLPWLIAAAVVLVVLGLTGVVRDLRDVAPDEHGHAHQTWLTWALLVPIALVAFVVPPPLDARGTNPPPAAVSAPKPRPFAALPAGPAPDVSLPEAVMRAAADSAHSLDGRTITLTGFTVAQAGRVDLGRVVIVCCAADAQLARVHLAGPAAAAAAGQPDDTWMRITGMIQPGSSHAEDGFVPTMLVADAVRIDKPKNAYAY